MSLIIHLLESMHMDLKITENCSRQSNLHSTCTFCVEACKKGVLSLNLQSIEINHEGCNSCGDCVIACPLSAIEGIVDSRDFFKGSLLYNESYTPTVKELLIYIKRGVKSIQTQNLPLNDPWKRVLTETNKVLEVVGEPVIEVVQKAPEEEKFSRRSFFTSLQREGKQLAKSMAPASWKLEVNQWKLVNYYPEYQFYTILMDRKKCTLCQACITFCTQEVFRIVNQTLQINHQKCVGCTACSDICSEDAIHIRTEVMKMNVEYVRLYSTSCLNCGQSFVTFHPETLNCHVCKDRDPSWLSPYQ
ncbi:4Fe-4S dicluster domain-containing protein [Neobacillus drentensis]|uniref:4Fe-4S dicluster domain-containing protein n=1 Tax=Neobacillus drentensis TaxID=220684 RepID=UPI003000C0C2